MCVSQTTGSGGDEVGKQVAERLEYLYVDEDIVARAAAAGGLEAGEIANEERRKSYVGRLLDTLAQGGGDAWTMGTTAAVEVIRPEDVRALIRETVVQTAARGKVVIVGHAASHALDPGPHMLRVFVTASPATRQKRIGGLAASGPPKYGECPRRPRAERAGARTPPRHVEGRSQESVRPPIPHTPSRRPPIPRTPSRFPPTLGGHQPRAAHE